VKKGKREEQRKGKKVKGAGALTAGNYNGKNWVRKSYSPGGENSKEKEKGKKKYTNRWYSSIEEKTGGSSKRKTGGKGPSVGPPRDNRRVA